MSFDDKKEDNKKKLIRVKNVIEPYKFDKIIDMTSLRESKET
jgi:hypothetical protein